MKILFISDVYFPRINGVSTSIQTFANELRGLGHQVHLMAPDYPLATAHQSWITRIPSHEIFFDPEDRLMRYSAALAQLPTLRQVQYDLIHIHTPFVAHYLGRKLSKQLNVPCVETYHTFFEDYLHHYLPWIPRGLAKRIARAISRRQCNEVQAVIAPSQPMLEALRNYGVCRPVEIVPTGLLSHSFADADGAAFRAKYGIALDRPVALFVGRVAFEKNIAFLLHMMVELRKRQPDVLLIIAGEGPAEQSLKSLSRKLALEDNIQFIGYLDREHELNACYRSADVFVFSSKSETQGLVLLEAMAQAIPVVALAELGTKSILIEGEGALIAPEDTRIFAEKVHSLFKDEIYRRKLGEAALHYARTCWTSHIQAERMAKFYEQVLRGR